MGSLRLLKLLLTMMALTAHVSTSFEVEEIVEDVVDYAYEDKSGITSDDAYLKAIYTLEAYLKKFDAASHFKIEFNVKHPSLPARGLVVPIDQIPSPRMLSGFTERTLRAIYSTTGYPKRINLTDVTSQYTAAFNPEFLPMSTTIKKVTEQWKSDDEFCRQFLQGPNPFQISMVQKPDEISEDLKELIKKKFSKNLEQLIAEKRLLIADYHEISSAPGLLPTVEGHYAEQDTILYAPIVLFYRGDGVKRTHNLNVIGIQLTRFQDKSNKVFTPDSKPNIWVYAKMLVKSSDNLINNNLRHLGEAHFALEPVAISFHNWKMSHKEQLLSNKNPSVLLLLEPHLRNVIATNMIADMVFLSDFGKTLGLASGSTATKLAMLNSFSKSNMNTYSFSKDMARRGFGETKDEDGVKGFFYRDDGFLLWNSLFNYVSTAVEATYKNDAEVKKDAKLENFFSDIGNKTKGNLAIFREEDGSPLEISSKEFLKEVLTAIIFRASAFHAVQNGVFEHYSVVLNSYTKLRVPMPMGDEDDMSMEQVLGSLPNEYDIKKMLVLSYLLSTPSHDTLANLDTKKYFPEAHRLLMQKLEDVKKTIDERNTKLMKEEEIPYPYLHPDNCASSVDT